MKSRKASKSLGKRRGKRTNERASKRMRAFETLEERQLLTVSPWTDGFYYPPVGVATAYLPPGLSQQEYKAISDQQYGNGPSGGGAEGQAGFASVSEVEPNSTFNQAQYVNLGTGPGKNESLNVIANLSIPVPNGQPDVDYFAFDLQAGDIVDARIISQIGSTFDLSILDANGREVIGNNGNAGGLYPVPESPLNYNDAVTDLAFVVPETGRYHARVSDGDLTYTLAMNARRPVLESEPIGTKQKLFLDFDGEIIRREAFGAVGTARLSPLVDFLPSWGLTEADEDRIIDKIIAVVESKFYGATAISGTGGNGDFDATGVPGQFAIEILNSRDHADPFGDPNVSRIIIGGTQAELLIPTIGIAESIDVGNFDTAESAVTLLDLIEPLWGQIPRAGNVPLEDVLVDAVGSVTAHEAGHFFGSWHTINSNASDQIMDTGGNLAGLIGVGPDGIYGTADDVDVQFGTDTYDPFASAIPFGRQNGSALTAWGLSTGKGDSALIRGTTYQDRNNSRSFDAADVGFPNLRVYADANNNGVYDQGEFATLSDPAGNYELFVAAGDYTIRQEVTGGFRVVDPVGNGISVSVTAGDLLEGRNFGNEKLNADITGTKFSDVNGNGLRDASEPTIEGVWVYIDLDNDNRIDIGEPATQTAADGSYKLDFPGTGTFSVREVVDPGFVQTFPGISNDGDPLNDFEHVVTLTGDPVIDASRASGLDFGNRLTVDFGDAPSSYGIARHGFVDGLRLGANWDAEQSSLFSDNATGDDATGALGANDQVIDDEDGVILSRPLVAGSANNRVSVDVTNTTGVPAFLSAWVDFNQDGDFTDANEGIITNITVQPGTQAVTFTAPPSAVLGTTFARFRLSQEPNAGATGEINTGEVEDYQFEVVASLDLAIDDQFTVARNSVQNVLDVLANDFALPGEQLEIVSLSAPSSGGTVQIGSNNDVLYTPPNGFVGQDLFTYRMRNSGGEIDEATVVVNVNLFFENPEAIDDSFTLATNSLALPLNVLSNDIEGQDGALTIVSVTQPDKGGEIRIATGGKSLRYTPPRNFGGTEFFTYTVGDSAGNQSSAQVTLHTLPGDRADDQVLIQLAATDLNGNPISAIQQGQQFKIDVIVDDLRWDAANPGDASVQAGVFAAYHDLLYNLQLVSTVAATDPSDRFNFDVEFDNGFTNFTRGDATLPGIIDEFGALLNASQLDQVDPVRLASITFVARSPGIANFTPDPADQFPDGDTLLFDTPGSAVPLEQIRYLGTSIEIVGDGVEFPVAVDDSVASAIPSNTLNFPIDVLANDQTGTSGPIEIVSVTDGANGLASIDTRGTADFGDDIVRYSPNGGFNGADQFTYTIADRRGIQSTATVTLRVGDADADDIVGLRLQATDLNGQPIDQITLGSQFQLRGYVDDLREDPILSGDPPEDSRGVFAAYQDVLYTSSLVSPVASNTNDPDLGFQVSFGPNYQRVREGDIRTVGVINEIGAVSTVDTPLGPDEQLLFVVTMTANSVGEANFIADPADISPLHDTLTYEPVSPVSFDRIRYGADTLQIVSAGGNGSGEGTNPNNRFDVNDDGFVSPIDVLAIVNSFRNRGGSGEGEGSGKFYLDVSADGYVSPFDALEVINYLNNGGGVGSGGIGNGEGEFAGLLSTPLATSESTPEATVPLTLDTEVLPESEIGVRDTGVVMGPMIDQGSFETAADSVFAESDDLGDLLDQLAPEIEKRRNIL